MAKYTLHKVAAVAAIASLATFGLSACAAPAPAPEPTQSAIGGDIVAPIELNYQDIDGQTLELVVGQVVNINYGGINDGEITVSISDPKVVEYSAAAYENDTQFSAGLKALSAGESTVTFTFAGEDPKELNIQVLLK
ncbi:MAG: hypothetical protein KGM14_05540 [Actinomycetales bacterium]|nr:hypothetical protein [Actinomycetales bacterium]